MVINHRLLKVLRKEPVDYTPVWMMRQAGRYLPEYRAVRQQAKDFLTLCKTPELACRVTLQPVERYPLDAAIIFSDILTIPDAMGLGLSFIEGEGPQFSTPIRTAAAVDKLATLDPATDLEYVMTAIRMVKHELGGRIPLIGFAGSPWTLACYMIEGGSSQQFHITRKMLYEAPLVLDQLLTHLTVAVTDYVQAQIEAGVDVVMLFDTWGGLLSPSYYEQYSLAYMTDIVQNLKAQVPVVIFTKNGGQSIESIVKSGCQAIGVDWMCRLQEIKQKVAGQVVIQGNLDPAALYASPKQIENAVAQVLQEWGSGGGHLFNLGHGIYPDINPDHVAVMVEAVQKLSKPYHA